MEELTRREKLMMSLTYFVGDLGEKAKQVVAEAEKRRAENSDWLLESVMESNPELVQSEEDCICGDLIKAIADAYFERITCETAIAIRDSLGTHGKICIDSRCQEPDLTFAAPAFVISYNAHHNDHINPYPEGYCCGYFTGCAPNNM